MIGSLILAAAMAAQAPPARPVPAAKKPAPAVKKATPAPGRPVNAARSRRAASYARLLREEAAEAAAMRAQAEADQRQYEKMLPYMLENQRQMLNYQVQHERNIVLDRAARAAEAAAGNAAAAAAGYPTRPSLYSPGP